MKKERNQISQRENEARWLLGCWLSLAICVGRFGIVRGSAPWHPGGHGARAGLLGHAVVADDCVEAPSRVGILGIVVCLQRSWDAALMLLRGKRRGGEGRLARTEE